MRIALKSMIIGLFVLLCGCSDAGHPMKQEQISQIVKGKTTESELIGMFGTPRTVSADSQGRRRLSWGYSHYDPMMSAFGIYGGQAKSQSLTATIGADGTVADYTQTSSETPNGWKQ